MFVVGLVFSPVLGCVRERCYADSHCPSPRVCSAEGRCVWRCTVDEECGSGFACRDHQCVPASAADVPGDASKDVPDAPTVVLSCPDDMALVADQYCVDRFEASRPDATADDPGILPGKAQSIVGVLPWRVSDNAEAQAACEAADKRLCTPSEWEWACRGPAGTVYGYGDTYDPLVCNGIETFGKGGFHLLPTGALAGCTNGYGLFDMNGNVWEHTHKGDETTIRGGAYNCSDSKTFHRCDYVPTTWKPSARGFRCCREPDVEQGHPPERADEPWAPDVMVHQDVPTPLDARPETETGGCLDPDFGSFPDFAPFDPGPKDVHSDLAPEPVPEAVPDAASDAAPEVVPDTFDVQDVGPALPCPPDMVLVSGMPVPPFCLDRYEASHSDATASSVGSSPVPASRPGVIPWFPISLAGAKMACALAGKRMCTTTEWFDACRGPMNRIYTYGDIYDPTVCNGIDTFCRCESDQCLAVAICPYPHCQGKASPAGDGGPCQADFRPVATGSFASCTNEWGAYDINGNVWELADGGDDLEHFRGGAYNCGDSEALHRCDHDGTWGPSARGFRCCANPQ